MSDSEEHSNERGQLDDLYDQGLLTDDEHRDAVRRVSSPADDDYDGSARRRLPRIVAFWPVLALLVGIGLIIFAIIGTGSKSGSTKEAGLAVNGAVVILQKDNGAAPDEAVAPNTQFQHGGFDVGKGCHTLSGFADIKSGATVVIADSSGAQVATTTLKPGVYDTNADCVFGFTTAVPKKSGYTIKVADRNAVPYSQSEIVSNPQLIL